MIYLWKAYTVGVRLHLQDMRCVWAKKLAHAGVHWRSVAARVLPYVLCLLISVLSYDVFRALAWVNMPVFEVPSAALTQSGFGDASREVPSFASPTGDTHAMVFRVFDLTSIDANDGPTQRFLLKRACTRLEPSATCLFFKVSFFEALSLSPVEKPPKTLVAALRAHNVSINLPSVNWPALFAAASIALMALLPLVFCSQRALDRAREKDSETFMLSQWIRVAKNLAVATGVFGVEVGVIVWMMHQKVGVSLVASAFYPATTIMLSLCVGVGSGYRLGKEDDDAMLEKVQSRIDRGFPRMESEQIGRAMKTPWWSVRSLKKAFGASSRPTRTRASRRL